MNLKKIVKSLFTVGVIGLIISLIAFVYDRIEGANSTAASEEILEASRVVQSQLSDSSDEIVKRISEVLEINAAIIEEGPVKDLAKLAKVEDPTKAKARSKLYSNHLADVIDGANQLLELADNKATAISSLSKTLAEDYRQAGAAFLLAKDLSSAYEAYAASTRFDPNYGFLTLSKIALAMEHFEDAEEAALSSLKGTDTWTRIFSLAQILDVYLSQGKYSEAQPYLEEIDEITRNGVLGDASFESETLLKAGLEVVKMRNNQKTSFKLFWAGNSTGTIQTLEGVVLTEDNIEEVGSAVAEYTHAIVNRELRLIALSKLYKFYTGQLESNQKLVEKYFVEAVATAFDILKLVNEYNRAPTTLAPHIAAFDEYLVARRDHAMRVELYSSYVAYLELELDELHRDLEWIESQSLPVEVIVEVEKEPIAGQTDFVPTETLNTLLNMLRLTLSGTYQKLSIAQVSNGEILDGLMSAKSALSLVKLLHQEEPSPDKLVGAEYIVAEFEVLNYELATACKRFQRMSEIVSTNKGSFSKEVTEMVEEKFSELCAK